MGRDGQTLTIPRRISLGVIYANGKQFDAVEKFKARLLRAWKDLCTKASHKVMASMGEHCISILERNRNIKNC